MVTTVPTGPLPLPIATLARLARVPYIRTWRYVNGGGVELKPDEETRILRVLDAVRPFTEAV